MNKRMPVRGQSNRNFLNEAIKLPEKIVTSDGRELAIKSWSPVIACDSLVEVTVQAVVKMVCDSDKG